MDGVGALGYLVILTGSLALSLVLVPAALRIAVKRQVLDHPGGYKTQAAPVPYLGGLAMLLAFAVVIGGAALLRPPVTGLYELLVILGAAVGLAIVGFVDDLRGLGVTVRVVATVGAALALWFGGTGVLLVGVGWIDATLTVAWVLGITHAMNLLDNMDGLSAGVATIAAITFFGIAVLNGQFLVAALSLALVGVSVGFLRHNRYPAKIYMGDAGSLFLGFMLAVIGIRLEFATVVEISVFVPIVVLAVPILDTALVTVSRINRGLSPFAGGADHVSHRLVKLGLPVPTAVRMVYGATIFSSWLAIAVSRLTDVLTAYLLIGLWIAVSAAAGFFLVRGTSSFYLARRPSRRGGRSPSTATPRSEGATGIPVDREV